MFGKTGMFCFIELEKGPVALPLSGGKAVEHGELLGIYLQVRMKQDALGGPVKTGIDDRPVFFQRFFDEILDEYVL